MAYAIKYRNEDEMKDSGIEWLGEIPREWEAKKLKFVFSYFKGKNPDTFVDSGSGGIPYVTTEYLRKGSTDYFVDSYKGLVKVFDDDILLLWDGANAGEFFNGKEGVLGSTFAKFDLISNNYKNYLKYCLWAFEFYLRANTTGMGLPHVNSEILKSLLLNLPINTLDQQKIANFLDIKTSEFDSIISKKEQLIEKLEEAKKSLISEVVTGKVKIVDGQLVDRKPEEMKDSGVEWLGMIPKDWEVKRIKQIAHLKSGETITGESIDEVGRYPVFGGNGLRGYTKNYTHEGNYILIGRQGALCGNINYSRDRFWVSEHAIVVNLLDRINIFWLGELLRTMNLNQYSVTAAQPGISVGLVNNLYIPFTNESEQNQISTLLFRKTKNLDSIITKTKQQITKLKEAKQSLISEAVTGKIDLRDWEIIEEEA